MRARCLRCRRPTAFCYCAKLPLLESATRVVILQHPRERDMPIGTARMASLALANAELHVGYAWDDHAGLRAALSDPARPPILLYPGEGARDVLADPPSGPVTLVVVDGTWSQARTLVRDSPILHALPRYAFAAPELSRYRIRKEPRDEYCSTIEALVHVLGALEGDREKFRALLAPFDAMIDAQIAAQAAAPTRGVRQLIRGKRSPLVPTVIVDALARWDDLVCIAAEANAWPYDAAGPKPPDEVVQIVAIRVATGEVFEALIAPDGPLSPSTPFHTRLDPELLREAPRDALARFAAFQRPTDVACVWGDHSAKLLGDALTGARFDVRDAARKRVNRVSPHARVGSLEAYAQALAPTTISILGHGRGGERASLLAAILGAWRLQFGTAMSIKDKIDNATDKVKDGVENLGEKAKNAVRRGDDARDRAADKIESDAPGVADKVRSDRTPGEKVKDKAGEAWQDVKDAAKDIKNDIKR